MPLFHRLLIVLGVAVVVGIVAFLVAWHYVLAAENIDRPSNIVITHDEQVDAGICEDGKIDDYEQCDDGNDIPFDGCTRCMVDGFFTCGGEPSYCVRTSEGLTGCGNGRLEKGELCDDGNGRDTDGCSYRCETEAGYLCEGAGAGSCRHRPPCGNGVIERGEQCDDANTADYDGCNSACQKDYYYDCSGTPSVCTPKVFDTPVAEEATPVIPVIESAAASSAMSIEMESEAASSSYSLSPRRRQKVIAE